MDTLKRSAFQREESSDALWWGLAGILSLASLWLPQLLDMRTAPSTQRWVTDLALFFSGGVIGGFRPNRVWRWGVAAFAAILLKGLMQWTDGMSLANINPDSLLQHFLANGYSYGLQAMAVVLGAYVSAMMMRTSR